MPDAIPTSAQIRQSFLDFFREKNHTIVPSSSLLPDSPNLLFTNAGMNQFVPIFLGERNADVSKWPGAIPASDRRAADTQKCIRAGGKHNDLDDVGLDTYHHTFFEMLGNWSFGDYFKKEAIAWAWELVVERWGFPANRLYATVYSPDKSLDDPSEFDQEAHDFWAEKFRAAGLDPAVHIVNGNKKDNFWMMGDTGPCGPCSELHVDLTQNGDTRGALVNKGSSECIEIWNLVFIQFNAQPSALPGSARASRAGEGASPSRTSSAAGDVSGEAPETAREARALPEIEFVPLAQKHVDTGMGFERVCSIIQCTKNFTDFGTTISNYETDVFRPIFNEIEKLSGKKYASTLPCAGTTGASEQEKTDIAFRVIADHIRTLSFAIADGIQPANEGRNYVLRRILRRAVRYGRTLGFHEPFFYKLMDILAQTMGDVFPEIRAKQTQVKETLKREEEAFNKTLDAGLEVFEEIQKFVTAFEMSAKFVHGIRDISAVYEADQKKPIPREIYLTAVTTHLVNAANWMKGKIRPWVWEKVASRDEIQFRDSVTTLSEAFLAGKRPTNIDNQLDSLISQSAKYVERGLVLPGSAAFVLYDTYGFPLDLTEVMVRESKPAMSIDVAGFETLMNEQRERARKAQKKEVITVSDNNLQVKPTRFLGYDFLETEAVVEAVAPGKQPDEMNLILDRTACYAEMGGQVGDHGFVYVPGPDWSEAGRLQIFDTQKKGDVFVHRAQLAEGRAPEVGEAVRISVDAARRGAIQRHHTVTHLLHWALHEVVSRDATQKGSFVGPDKLTFDFNSAPLTPAQVRDVERLVNEKILENAAVSWTEVPFSEIKGRADVMQFFGEKYGDLVRVVQIGGQPQQLNGYSMELCGGTHARATGAIGLFKIVSEAAIAAGVRRIEAIAGLNAYAFAANDNERLKTLAAKLNAPLGEIEKKLDALLSQQKELEKQLKAAQQKQAAETAKTLFNKAQTLGSGANATPAIVERIEDASGDDLQTIADALKGQQFKGVLVLAGKTNENQVALLAAVSPDFTAKFQAGKIIQHIAPIIGGKGGGRPDSARGAGKNVAKIDEALTAAKALLG